MNERIKELASQCWDLRLDGKHFDQEQFAELIVQECIEQVKVFNVRMDARPRHIVEAIQQHFGVKE
jgi:ribosomal protein L23